MFLVSLELVTALNKNLLLFAYRFSCFPKHVANLSCLKCTWLKKRSLALFAVIKPRKSTKCRQVSPRNKTAAVPALETRQELQNEANRV